MVPAELFCEEASRSLHQWPLGKPKAFECGKAITSHLN